MMRKSGAFGFSLVELMIVVAIVGILATIGVPVYRNMRMKAYRAEGISNLGYLNKISSQYIIDHPEYPLFEGYFVDESTTNCNTDAPNAPVSSFNPMPGLGFGVENCKDRRWAYYVKARNPGGEYIVYAVSLEKALFGCPRWSEQFTMSNCRRLCHKKQISDPSTCASPPESFCGYTDAYSCN